MNIEEQIKKCIDEVYNKYKNITDEENKNKSSRPHYWELIMNEYMDFMESLSTDIAYVDEEMINKYIHYASDLSHDFQCEFLGRVFYHEIWSSYEYWSYYAFRG